MEPSLEPSQSRAKGSKAIGPTHPAAAVMKRFSVLLLLLPAVLASSWIVEHSLDGATFSRCGVLDGNPQVWC